MDKETFLHELVQIASIEKVLRWKEESAFECPERLVESRKKLVKRCFDLLDTLYKYLPEEGEL